MRANGWEASGSIISLHQMMTAAHPLERPAGGVQFGDDLFTVRDSKIDQKRYIIKGVDRRGSRCAPGAILQRRLGLALVKNSSTLCEVGP